jgi:hypothetical protein
VGVAQEAFRNPGQRLAWLNPVTEVLPPESGQGIGLYLALKALGQPVAWIARQRALNLPKGSLLFS